MPHLEIHPLTGAYVIVAPERSHRPNSRLERSPEERCPFCRGHEIDTPPELERVTGNDGEWEIRVVPNRYPAVTPEGSELRGLHEVIVDASIHDSSPFAYGVSELVSLLNVYQRRVRNAFVQNFVEYAVLFKNSGGRAGETLTHPHSQLLALDRRPRPGSGACVVCAELLMATIIDREGDVLAVAPRGARLPFEVWLTRETHGRAFTRDDALQPLATLLRRLLRRLSARFGHPAFNWYVEETRDASHWVFVVAPRVTNVAGFELASGMWINVVEPERVARELGRSESESA